MVVTQYHTGAENHTPHVVSRKEPAYGNVNAHGARVLQVRGISPAVARDYGIESWSAAQSAAYGFRGEHARDGLAIPNYNLLGELDGVQLRPERPVGERKYLWLRNHTPQIGGPPAGTPEAAARADRLRRDLRVAVVASESNIKNGAMLSNTARPIFPISIHGNWNWVKNGAIDDAQLRWIPRYEKTRGKITYRRPLILAPDSNYWTKPEVAAGWWHFANAARGLGFDVRVAVVPHAPNGTSWGPDDAIAAGAVTVDELIDTARPLPEIMPAINARPVDDGPLSREEQLARRVAELEADNAALISLVLNPHLSHTEKVAYVSAGVKVQEMAAKGEVRALEDAEIANDYRPAKRPKGTPKPTTNPTGTMPIMERAAAKSAMERARERGWFTVKTVPHTITRSNGTTYTTNAWQVEPAPSLGALIMPAAIYVPEAVKERKAYTRQTPCPHCDQVHDRVQVTYCGGYSADGEIIDGCQREISRKVIQKPVAQRPEISEAQREHLDNITRDETQPARPADAESMSGINQDIVTNDAPVNTCSSPAPINCPEKITTWPEPAETCAWPGGCNAPAGPGGRCPEHSLYRSADPAPLQLQQEAS